MRSSSSSRALLAGHLAGDLVEHMHGAEAKRCVLQAKDMARNKIFPDAKRKTLREIGAYTTLEILLNTFFVAQRSNSTAGAPPRSRAAGCSDLIGNNAPDHARLAARRVPAHDRLHRRDDRRLCHEMAREMTGRSSPPESHRANCGPSAGAAPRIASTYIYWQQVKQYE